MRRSRFRSYIHGFPEGKLWICEINALFTGIDSNNQRGDFKAIQKLPEYEKRRFVPRHLVVAIENDRMDIVQFLTDTRHIWRIEVWPWHTSTCIAFNRLKILKYFHELGSDYVVWDNTFELAIRYNRYSILKYLIDEGFSVTEDHLRLAIKLCDWGIIRLLYEALSARYRPLVLSRKTQKDLHQRLENSNIDVDGYIKKYAPNWKFKKSKCWFR
jgi:hypothetical protein